MAMEALPRTMSHGTAGPGTSLGASSLHPSWCEQRLRCISASPTSRIRGVIRLYSVYPHQSMAFVGQRPNAISKSGSCFQLRSISRRKILCVSNGLADAAFTNAGEDEKPEETTLLQKCRAVIFYVTTVMISMPLFVVMLLQHPFVLLLDKYRRKSQHLVNKIWASLSTSLFYKVEIIGKGNLPGADEPAVYIANHQSFLDIYALFQLGRPFKFVSKTSNFFIPFVGWSMYLTGHIPLRRLDKKSQLECLRRCIELLKKGVSVFFFPEGTRTTDGKMATFKKGAFTIAAKAKVPVIPIALIGTGNLMPNGKEYILRSGEVKVVIHPPIRAHNADELCIQSRKAIANTLLKHGLDAH